MRSAGAGRSGVQREKLSRAVCGQANQDAVDRMQSYWKEKHGEVDIRSLWQCFLTLKAAGLLPRQGLLCCVHGSTLRAEKTLHQAVPAGTAADTDRGAALPPRPRPDTPRPRPRCTPLAGAAAPAPRRSAPGIDSVLAATGFRAGRASLTGAPEEALPPSWCSWCWAAGPVRPRPPQPP